MRLMISTILLVEALTMTSVHASPSSVAITQKFAPDAFGNPDALLWPGYFWLWNAPLDPEIIRAQLRDMASHGARSVCMLPMPHGFRPDSTNNGLDPDYLTPEFFQRVRVAVEEAAALGMNWWLYDEGGWPSGSALGKVTDGRPEFCQHRLAQERIEPKAPFTVPEDAFALVVEKPEQKTLRPGEVWTPSGTDDAAVLYRVKSGGYADLLNPQATQRFIELTHEGYRQAVGDFFGKTIRFTFTDEPNAPNLDPPKTITWTPGMDAAFKDQTGQDITAVLPLLFSRPASDAPIEVARARIAFYDLWTRKFRTGYFEPLRDWDREHALASGGHLNGEDETINAVRYGFGQALRQLRAMDVPGVDLIWRQLFPGRKEQHFFPKYASSAAHQNGTRYAFTESFCVYGNGVTPAQMKWLINYQYIRGLNLLVAGCYPMSTRDHHMTGERPHFGPANPYWDQLAGFHVYTARLGYALSIGSPKIATALYYPVRDLWALGEPAKDAVESHDRLAAELFSHQCDFDLIDDDLLADPATRIEGKEMLAGAMRYGTIICGKVCWMHPDTLARLKQFAESGGQVIFLDHAPGTDGTPGTDAGSLKVMLDAASIAESAPPTATISPANGNIRAAARVVGDGEILALFNEGDAAYDGTFETNLPAIQAVDLMTGGERRTDNHLHLEPGEMRVLHLRANQDPKSLPALTRTDETLHLAKSLTAEPRRRFTVGEHDFEVAKPEAAPAPFAKASKWEEWLTADFSGEVDYKVAVEIPQDWNDTPLRLETGPIEYAATVLLDGKEVGYLLWPPWTLDLPSCTPGHHELVIRVANTLANELTSERVVQLWSDKKGPGWPSPYHKRAIEFEKESRGGGLQGPVQLRRMKQEP